MRNFSWKIADLVPDLFIKNQKWAYLLINSLKCYKICFLLYVQIEAKKNSSFVSGNRPGEIFFIIYPPAKVECVWEYIYFVSKIHTHKQKKFPLANLFVRIYVFSHQTIKYRALCSSAKKSAVRVDF